MSLTKKDKEEIKKIVWDAISAHSALLDDLDAGSEIIKQQQFQSWEENAIKLDCGVVLAPEDYHEGERKFFNWDEAMEIEKKSNGKWRLPTPKEWMMICAELGTDEDGVFDAEVLEKNTGMKLNGWVLDDDMDDYRENPSNVGTLNNQGAHGLFWSATAKSDTGAYNLDFNSGDLSPQSDNGKGHGLTVRCVKGVN